MSDPILMPGCPTDGCPGVIMDLPQFDHRFCQVCERAVTEAEIVWWDVSVDPPQRVGVPG